MPNGHVTHAEREGFHVLRYFGRVDYMLATSINRFADRMIENGHVGGLVFDLTEAENLDSTNLGLLARIAERVKTAGGGRSVIVSTSDNINCVLRSMCFDQIFDIVTDPTNFSIDGEGEIAPEPQSQEDLLHTMLDAHRTLVSLSEADRLQFQDVVACLESELKESEQKTRS
jgi:anti-anti-sigma factor